DGRVIRSRDMVTPFARGSSLQISGIAKGNSDPSAKPPRNAFGPDLTFAWVEVNTGACTNAFWIESVVGSWRTRGNKLNDTIVAITWLEVEDPTESSRGLPAPAAQTSQCQLIQRKWPVSDVEQQE